MFTLKCSCLTCCCRNYHLLLGMGAACGIDCTARPHCNYKSVLCAIHWHTGIRAALLMLLYLRLQKMAPAARHGGCLVLAELSHCSSKCPHWMSEDRSGWHCWQCRHCWQCLQCWHIVVIEANTADNADCWQCLQCWHIVVIEANTVDNADCWQCLQCWHIVVIEANTVDIADIVDNADNVDTLLLLKPTLLTMLIVDNAYNVDTLLLLKPTLLIMPTLLTMPTMLTHCCYWSQHCWQCWLLTTLTLTMPTMLTLLPMLHLRLQRMTLRGMEAAWRWLSSLVVGFCCPSAWTPWCVCVFVCVCMCVHVWLECV